MNINSQDKNNILEAIGYSIDNSSYELECLINNSNTPYNPNIKHDDLIAIIKRFKGRPDFESNENVRLSISFSKTSKYNNVRILIKGIGPINNFCNNENLLLIKNSIDFEEKSKVKVKQSSIYINNYGIKFNLKQENNFNDDESRINELIRDFASEDKEYRYKKTFSFQKKTKDLQIDVSIVKSNTVFSNTYVTVKKVKEDNLINLVMKPFEIKDSFTVWWKSIENKPNEKVKIKGASNYYKNIKDSSVFTNIPTYEAEIEYIKNKTFIKPKFKTITERKEYIQNEYVNYFKYIGSILQCVQGSLYLLSKDEIIDVENKFIKVVGNSITDTMIFNKTIGSDDRDGSDKYQKNKGFGGKEKDKYKGKPKNYQKGGQIDGQIDNENINESEESKIENSSGSVTDSVSGYDSDNTDKYNSEIIENFDNEIQYNKIEEDKSDIKIIEDTTKNISGGNVSDYQYKNNENDEHNENDEQLHQEGGARKIARIKFEIMESLRKKGIFFGPLIIDLTHNNSAKINPDAIPDIKTNTNIHINYLVTDKTDGDRNLLFFDETGKIYGIDRKNNIKSYGATIPSLANSILDGEHITRSDDDKILNNFYIFDAYIYKGENVMIKPFNFSKNATTEGRYKCILNAYKLCNQDMNIQLNKNLPFRIFKKDYYPSDSPESYAKLREGEKPIISENCEFLLNKMNVKYGGYLKIGHMFSYKTDGLVFLPNNLSVFQKYEDDYDSISNPFKRASWKNNYKWKPTEHLTIDFKIEFVKEMSSGHLDYKYFDNKKYLKVNLISSVWQSKDPKSKLNNKLNFYLLNSGLKIHSIPEDFKFFATNPFFGSYDDEGNLQNNMGEAYFEVDENDNLICKNGSFITDGVICECSYNKKIKDEIMRWIPERVRADKTHPNEYNTAVTAWELINNPITKDFLSNKQKLNIKGEEKEVNLENVAYYSSNKATVKLTKPFTLFANYVKRYIIDRALTGYVRPKVLDLGVGKLGELDKYSRAGVHTLVGLDINEDSINNQEDGASTRIMDLSKNIPAIAKLADKTMLIVGNATKNITNGESTRDNINKYYIDVLYGRAKGNTPKLRKMEGVGLSGFDMVSCMYAIHYMMNSEDDLDNYLRNVSENLLEQGYFIGTCLNGDAVLNEMGNKDEIKGIIDNKTVFIIKKKNSDDDDTSFKNNYKNITVGNKINVFFETFGSAYDENLVSIPYIKEKAKKHNLKLVDYKSFLEEPGNLLSMYESSTEDWVKNPQGNADAIKNSKAMMTWAKMNCYFIFQKVRKA